MSSDKPTKTRVRRSEPKPNAPLDRDAVLAELSAEFDRRLAVLNAPGAHERIDAVFAARGRTKVRPKAGPTF